MLCSNCGKEISEQSRYCPECGKKVISNLHTIQLKCKGCGGILSIDENRPILFCPYCGSKELLNEDSDVTIQRIKSKTYKEVEFERMRLAEAREERQAAQMERDVKEKRYEQFRKGKRYKILIVFFILGIFFTFVSFSAGKLLCALIALTQTVLFAVAWLMGMQFIKEKKPRISTLLPIIAALLIVPYIWAGNRKAPRAIVKSPEISQDQQTDEANGIFTYQIRNYVGKNLASIGKQYGYYRIDEYGNGQLRINYVSPNGIFINPEDEEQLKQYVVTGQSIPEKTQLTIVNQRDSRGKPYSSIVDYQNYEEIVLFVDVVGGNATTISEMEMMPSLNRRTCYVRNYVGRNAASIGKQYGSGRVDEYFEGKLRLEFSAKDGSYVDDSNLDVLKQFVVISQDVPANEEFHLVYETDSNGEEYDSLIRSQSIETISLVVEKLDDTIIAQMPKINKDN